MGRRLVAYEQRGLLSGGRQWRKSKKGTIASQGFEQSLRNGHGATFTAFAAGNVITPDARFGVTSKLAHDGAETRPGRHLGNPQITGIHQTDEKAAALMLCRAFGSELFGGLHHIGPLQLGEGLRIFTSLLGARTFNPLQQESRIAIHVLLLDEKLEEGGQNGEFCLHRLLTQSIRQLPAQFPLAKKRTPQGVWQPFPPLLVEHELGDVAIGNQSGRWRLAIVEIAHHDAPGEIPGADGHLAKTPVQKSGQLTAIGLVVVFAVALLQQPVDGQLIHDPRVGDLAKTQGGEVLVDLGIARFKVVHAIEQWHGGWKCWMSHDGV